LDPSRCEPAAHAAAASAHIPLRMGPSSSLVCVDMTPVGSEAGYPDCVAAFRVWPTLIGKASGPARQPSRMPRPCSTYPLGRLFQHQLLPGGARLVCAQWAVDFWCVSVWTRCGLDVSLSCEACRHVRVHAHGFAFRRAISPSNCGWGGLPLKRNKPEIRHEARSRIETSIDTCIILASLGSHKDPIRVSQEMLKAPSSPPPPPPSPSPIPGVPGGHQRCILYMGRHS